jgi:membrane-bound ClpP family serine protease
VTGFALSVAGAISFVLGSLFLFSPFVPSSPTLPRLSISPWLLVLMTLLLVGFFSFAMTAGLRAQQQKVLMGRGRLIGVRGTALSELAPEGVVQVQSETWTAVAPDLIRAGEMVEVVDSDGLNLQVRRVG